MSDVPDAWASKASDAPAKTPAPAPKSPPPTPVVLQPVWRHAPPTATNPAVIVIVVAAVAVVLGAGIVFATALTRQRAEARAQPVAPVAPIAPIAPVAPPVVIAPMPAEEPPAPLRPPEPSTQYPSQTGYGCDEVSCVLNNYEPSCCARFKKTGASGTGSAIPESLDREIISTGVAAIKAKVQACGDKSTAKGRVKVHVKVAPAGDVAEITVSDTPDALLGECVSAAMNKAHFARTQHGGTFSYPFIF